MNILILCLVNRKKIYIIDKYIRAIHLYSIIALPIAYYIEMPGVTTINSSLYHLWLDVYERMRNNPMTMLSFLCN